MNCRKAKDLILSDYTDNELSLRIKTEIDKHLEKCAACRKFQETLQDKIIQPLKQAKEIMPPDYVWERIREEIEAKTSQCEQPGFSIFTALRQKCLRRPQGVFAAALAVIAIFFALFLTKSSLDDKRHLNEYFADQVEFFNYLGDDGKDADFGTATENYFL
jgi:hypothetical protein